MSGLSNKINSMFESRMNNDDVNETPSSLSMGSFLASSVHDMKNSVSMLIGGLEKALATADSENLTTYNELVHMNHEAKRINSNLIQLLTLYKLGQQIYPFDPQSICVEDFLHSLAAQNSELLKSHGIALEIHADPALYWYFDEDLISGVIGNALNNAMRYTHDCISLIANNNNGVLELRIEDNGAGYPPSMLQESVDNMRGVDFQGGSTGLGLYFSSVVARLHQNHGQLGEVMLENGGSLEGGCFVLNLP